MADDTLDFVAPADKLGKPVHNDLKEGKITLPIISLLQQASPEESQFVTDYVKQWVRRRGSPAAGNRPPAQVRHPEIHPCQGAGNTSVRPSNRSNPSRPAQPWDTLYAIADYVTTRDV